MCVTVESEMRALISGYARDESSARIIEYGLVVASIVIAVIVIVQFIGSAF